MRGSPCQSTSKTFFEQAFSKALEQTLQTKAEHLFKHAFENGSELSKKLEEKIDAGFRRFVEEGIRWEKRKPGLDAI